MGRRGRFLRADETSDFERARVDADAVLSELHSLRAQLAHHGFDPDEALRAAAEDVVDLDDTAAQAFLRVGATARAAWDKVAVTLLLRGVVVGMHVERNRPMARRYSGR